MNLTYKRFSSDYLDELCNGYIEYYNNSNGAKWTYEKAERRIQMYNSMCDSFCLLQFEDSVLTGFLMGYFKVFDDSIGFFLEEILIFSPFQSKGYGSDFINYLKGELKSVNCDFIELLTTLSPSHQNFYGKNGFKICKDLVLEYIDLK